MKSNSKQQNGFTIIELLVVMGIMVLLMSLVGAAVIGLGKRADEAKNKSMIGALISAMDQFQADFHMYPPLTTLDSGSSTTNSLSYFLCNKFMAPDGLPKGPYLSPTKLQAHGEIGILTTTSSVPAGPGIPALHGGSTAKGVSFIILDVYGTELFYNPGPPSTTVPPKDWSTFVPAWTDNRKTFDLYSFGRNGIDDGNPPTVEDFDDLGNFNLR